MKNAVKVSIIIVSVMLGLSLQGCQSPQAKKVEVDVQELSRLALAVVDGQKKVDNSLQNVTKIYIADFRKQGCQATNGLTGLFYNSAMSKHEQSLKLIQEATSGNAIHRDLLIDTQIRSSRVLAESRLSVADAALSAKCYVEASSHYRSVIAFFVGPAYAAYRQRAEIGLSDIRSIQAF